MLHINIYMFSGFIDSDTGKRTIRLWDPVLELRDPGEVPVAASRR